MKTKTLVAYEAESSTTIRLTPIEIGRLVSQIPDDKLVDFITSLTKEAIFMTAQRRQLLRDRLVQCQKAIKEIKQ